MVGYLEAEFAALQRSKDATIRTLEPRVGGWVGGLAGWLVWLGCIQQRAGGLAHLRRLSDRL